MNTRTILLVLMLATGLRANFAVAQEVRQEFHVAPVPETLRTFLSLSPFYKKYVDARGFPVLGSEAVSDGAMLEAARIVCKLLENRDDVRDAMVRNKIRLAVMAKTEFTTDVPEHSDLAPKAYWNQRARGLGATQDRPAISCAEENLLHLEGDRYPNENILVHEFSHSIHEFGLNALDPIFNEILTGIYQKSVVQNKRWKRTYAASNYKEFWAEGVQSYFECNDNNNPLHNDICTRLSLKEYDPELFALIDAAFKQSAWKYEHPGKLNPPRPALKDALVHVSNDSGAELVLYWMNGEREYQNASIASGRKYALETYVGDRWRAKIEGRETSTEYRVESVNSEWVIK